MEGINKGADGPSGASLRSELIGGRENESPGRRMEARVEPGQASGPHQLFMSHVYPTPASCTSPYLLQIGGLCLYICASYSVPCIPVFICVKV